MENLSLDGLKEMKKAEYIKAFKNKAAWKKADAVILLVDYRLDGKKVTIAVPYKKVADMKSEMKRLKKEKLHLMKKSGGATFCLEKGPNGPVAKIELLSGGLTLKDLEGKVSDLFDILKLSVETSQSAAAAAEAAAETDDAETTVKDTAVSTKEEEVEEIAVDNEETTVAKKLSPEEKVKMKENLTKIEENINKLFAKLSSSKG